MRVIYLLDRPELSGGVKVVFQHAQMLIDEGVDTSIAAIGPKPVWIDFNGAYIDLSRQKLLPGNALVIATYWTTLSRALEMTSRVVHFCQGYEGNFPHLVSVKEEIEACYGIKVPTFVVSPHLEELLAQRFDRQCHLVQPPVDPLFDRNSFLPNTSNHVPRIFISGIFEAVLKGVPTALEAVNIIRQRGIDCEVVRVSLFPPSEEEQKLLQADVFLTQIDPVDVAAEMFDCDLCLFTSHPQEGFGLTMLEAMASGVPVVGPDIPSIKHMTRGRLKLASYRDPTAFADLAMAMLTDPAHRNASIRTGYKLSRNYHPDRIKQQLIRAVTHTWHEMSTASK